MAEGVNLFLSSQGSGLLSMTNQVNPQTVFISYSHDNPEQENLIRLWPRWVGVQSRIFGSERPFWRGAMGFERFVNDLFNH
jgi:hypothetical protein